VILGLGRARKVPAGTENQAVATARTDDDLGELSVTELRPPGSPTQPAIERRLINV
jgi:hypothetical protein